MPNILFYPKVVQRVFHLCDWTADKTEMIEANGQVVCVEPDSHIHWPDAFKSIDAQWWAHVGVCGVDLLGSDTVRGRLSDAVTQEKLALVRNGTTILTGMHGKQNHLIIDPQHSVRWSEILVTELDRIFGSGQHEYRALFLDKFGDLPFFLSENGIRPTAEDAEDWYRMLRQVHVVLSRACKGWGLRLYVNGEPHGGRHLFSGRFWENIPNQPTWAKHILGDETWPGVEEDSYFYDVLIGENGGRYRDQCLAVSMVYGGWFFPRCNAGLPLVLEPENVAGQWIDVSLRAYPDKADPYMLKRKFQNVYTGEVREASVKFTEGWRKIEYKLPWKEA